MWRYFGLVALTFLLQNGNVRVEVRKSEVWLVRDGEEKQLTNDGKAKLQAELSPSKDRIAYYEQCPENEHCTPTVIVLDLEGHRTRSFQLEQLAASSGGLCNSILSISWAGSNAISVECHINPSLSEYIETDLETGQTTRDLLGYDFTLSPDGKKVAHVGWIPHFAPPFAKSNYLQLDNTTVYPLPEGAAPVEQKDLSEPPDVVDNDGLSFFGIHEFVSGLRWSPDSQHIALVDCTYDWTAKNSDFVEGTESENGCSVVVVSVTGKLQLFPLAKVSRTDLPRMDLEWTEPEELTLYAAGTEKSFRIK